MLNKKNNFLSASLLQFLPNFLNRMYTVHLKRKVVMFAINEYLGNNFRTKEKVLLFATRVQWRFSNFSFFLSCFFFCFFYTDSPHQYFQILCFLQKKNPDTDLFFFLFFIKVNHKCSCLFTKMSEMKNHQFLIWGLLINKAR